MSGLFETSTISDDLFNAWVKRSKFLSQERYRPYADLLLDKVLWPAMLVKKDSILAALKAKCEMGSSPSDLQVPIWNYNFIQNLPKSYRWVQGPPQEFALERGDAEAHLNQAIYDNLWNHTLGVQYRCSTYDECEYHTLAPVGIDKIVTKTDVLTQLALRFGSKFRVVRTVAAISETHPKTGEPYYRYEATLYLQYFPFGLPEQFAKVQRECQQHLRTRGARHTLEDGEMLEVNCA